MSLGSKLETFCVTITRFENEIAGTSKIDINGCKYEFLSPHSECDIFTIFISTLCLCPRTFTTIPLLGKGPLLENYTPGTQTKITQSPRHK